MKSIILIFLLTLSVSIHLKAQSVKELENDFSELSLKLKNEQSVLDSLKRKLNSRVNKINAEKKKKESDTNKLQNIMASSIVISNNVDAQQKKVEELKNKINSMKKLLVSKYSAIIDSLNNELAKDANDRDKEKLKSRIIIYTEKRLKMYPAVKLLSFHPGKILQINLKATKDTAEKKLYKEYLEKALSEVDNRLKNAANQDEQISQMIKLREKTKRFLEESEFEGNIRPQSFSSKTTVTDAGSYTNIGGPITKDASKAAFSSQVQYYTLLLNQLSINPLTNSKPDWQFSPDSSGNIRLSMEQYHKLLSEVKKRLKDYQVVLMHKLGKTQ